MQTTSRPPLRPHGFRGNRLYWFRVAGVGLHVKDTRRHRLLFSERNGSVRRVQLGPWSVKWLGRIEL